MAQRKPSVCNITNTNKERVILQCKAVHYCDTKTYFKLRVSYF